MPGSKLDHGLHRAWHAAQGAYHKAQQAVNPWQNIPYTVPDPAVDFTL